MDSITSNNNSRSCLVEGDSCFYPDCKSKAVAALVVTKRKEIRKFGLALIDLEKFQLQLCEFQDDAHLTLCESVFLQTRPIKCFVKLSKECLLGECGLLLGFKLVQPL